MIHHLQLNSGVFDVGLAKGGAFGVLHQKNVLEGHGLVNAGLKTVEVVIAVGLQPELLT